MVTVDDSLADEKLASLPYNRGMSVSCSLASVEDLMIAHKTTVLGDDSVVGLGEDVVLDDGAEHSIDVTTLLVHMLRHSVGDDKFIAKHSLSVLLEVRRISHEVVNDLLARRSVGDGEVGGALEEGVVQLDRVLLVILGILHAQIAGANLDADGKDGGEGENTRVLGDEAHGSRFRPEEEARDAGKSAVRL